MANPETIPIAPCEAPADPAEAARLAALRRLDILDTPPEAGFDRIARLACGLMAAPIGLVTLVDEQRVWFKACVGLDACESPRREAFCPHTIEGERVMVVPDACSDARFADSPVVAGEPAIRFYAGAPMIARDGHRLGAVCVADFAPRPGVDAGLQSALADLAAVAVEMIEMRRAALEAHREAESRRIAEAAVAEALIAARDAFGARERLLSHVSHELRTPLNGVTGMLSLLQRSARDAAAQRMIDVAMQSAEAMIFRVEELLNAAALSAHTARLDALPVRPAVVLERAVAEYGPAARRKGLALRAEHAFGAVEILADEGALRQVLACLLDNAVKFTLTGAIVASGAMVDGGASGPMVRFEVSDTGLGVPDAARGSIFDWFEMIERDPTRLAGGCGLGLSIAREFVALMGGDIGFDSVEGEGSTFWFTAPAQRVVDRQGDGAPS